MKKHTTTHNITNTKAHTKTQTETDLARLLTDSQLLPLCVAESCTAGLIASTIGSVAGSSNYFDRGLVTYSNKAKSELLGVDPEIFEKFGAVSKECALAMLEGLFEKHGALLGAATTGIAGPDGGTPEKPVGTVWIAWGTKAAQHTELLNLRGERNEVRIEATKEVIKRLCKSAEEA
jgi:nicotinamide-nucleotide amidase